MIFDVHERTLPSGLKVKVRELKTSEAAILRQDDKDLYQRFAKILDSAVTYTDDSGIEVQFNTMEQYEADIATLLTYLRIVTFDDKFKFEIECPVSYCDFGKKSRGFDPEFHEITLNDELVTQQSDKVYDGKYILDISGNRKVIMRLTKGKDIKKFQKIMAGIQNDMTAIMIYLSEGVIIEETSVQNDALQEDKKIITVDKSYSVRPLNADELRVKDVSIFEKMNSEIGGGITKIEFDKRCPICSAYVVDSLTKTNTIPLFTPIFFSI